MATTDENPFQPIVGNNDLIAPPPAPNSGSLLSPPGLYGTVSPPSSASPTSTSATLNPISAPPQIVQNQQKLSQLNMYRTQQQQQIQQLGTPLGQPSSLGQPLSQSYTQTTLGQSLGQPQNQSITPTSILSAYPSSMNHGTYQQQQQPSSQSISQPLSQPQPTLGQQQQQLQQFMAKMTENFDRMHKYLSDVDQRIAALEKCTREISVNQKTQKETLQQQYLQILQKIGEIRTTIPAPAQVQMSPFLSAPITTPTTTSNFVAAPAPNVSTTAQYRPSARDQEDADAELARRLQAELNAESSKPAARVEPTEECPICSEKVVKSKIEEHVNKHLDEDAKPPASATGTESSLWGRLFGRNNAEAEKKKQEEEKKKQEENSRPSPAPAAMVSPVPFQQPYYLAPAGFALPPNQSQLQPVVYRPQTDLYPAGQIMYQPAPQGSYPTLQ